MIYRACPRCGANLDPGEHCDCQDEEKGRSAGTGATSRNELPLADYHSARQKSSAYLIFSLAMKGAAT